jgi:hypothetical protein
MGLSADPQAFVPVAGKADLRAAGSEAGTGSSRSGQLDPLIAALRRAVERSGQGPNRDADPGSTG